MVTVFRSFLSLEGDEILTVCGNVFETYDAHSGALTDKVQISGIAKTTEGAFYIGGGMVAFFQSQELVLLDMKNDWRVKTSLMADDRIVAAAYNQTTKKGILALASIAVQPFEMQNEQLTLSPPYCTPDVKRCSSALITGTGPSSWKAVFGTIAGDLALWESSEPRKIAFFDDVHKGPVLGMASVVPNYLFSIGDDRCVSVAKLLDNSIKFVGSKSFSDLSSPLCVCGDSSGNVYTSGNDEVIRCWSFSSEGELVPVREISCPVGPVTAMIAIDDKSLFAASMHGMIARIGLGAVEPIQLPVKVKEFVVIGERIAIVDLENTLIVYSDDSLSKVCRSRSDILHVGAPPISCKPDQLWAAWSKSTAVFFQDEEELVVDQSTAIANVFVFDQCAIILYQNGRKALVVSVRGTIQFAGFLSYKTPTTNATVFSFEKNGVRTDALLVSTRCGNIHVAKIPTSTESKIDLICAMGSCPRYDNNPISSLMTSADGLQVFYKGGTKSSFTVDLADNGDITLDLCSTEREDAEGLVTDNLGIIQFNRKTVMCGYRNTSQFTVVDVESGMPLLEMNTTGQFKLHVSKRQGELAVYVQTYGGEIYCYKPTNFPELLCPRSHKDQIVGVSVVSGIGGSDKYRVTVSSDGSMVVAKLRLDCRAVEQTRKFSTNGSLSCVAALVGDTFAVLAGGGNSKLYFWAFEPTNILGDTTYAHFVKPLESSDAVNSRVIDIQTYSMHMPSFAVLCANGNISILHAKQRFLEHLYEVKSDVNTVFGPLSKTLEVANLKADPPSALKLPCGRSANGNVFHSITAEIYKKVGESSKAFGRISCPAMSCETHGGTCVVAVGFDSGTVLMAFASAGSDVTTRTVKMLSSVMGLFLRKTANNGVLFGCVTHGSELRYRAISFDETDCVEWLEEFDTCCVHEPAAMVCVDRQIYIVGYGDEILQLPCFAGFDPQVAIL